ESRGYRQILLAASPFLDRIANPSSADDPDKLTTEAEEKIAYSEDRERQAVASVLRLVPENRRTAMRVSLEPMLDDLGRFRDLQIGRIHNARAAAGAPRITTPAKAAVQPRDSLPAEAAKI